MTAKELPLTNQPPVTRSLHTVFLHVGSTERKKHHMAQTTLVGVAELPRGPNR